MIIEQLRAGHEPTWAKFFDTIQPALFDAIEKETGNRQDAEDLMGHIMLAVVRSIAPAPVPEHRPSGHSETSNQAAESPLELSEKTSS